MGSVSQENAYDKVDEASAKIVGEAQLKKYTSFMDGYAHNLSNLEEAVGGKQHVVWEKSLCPVILKTSPEERISLPNLIRTDNQILNKVLITLSSLCMEVNTLAEEAWKDFYDPLMFYGEGVNEDEEEQVGGDSQVQIGRMLPLFQRLTCFLQRCREVLKNTVQQLAALHNKTMPKVIDATHVHFTVVYEHIGKLLRCLITIDTAVSSNAFLQAHWSQYKLMLKQVGHNPSNFDVDAGKLKPLDKLVTRFENSIIKCKLLQTCLNQNFDDSGIPVSKNSYFAEEFTYNLKVLFSQLDPRIGDQSETNHRLKYVGLCSLLVLQHRLFHSFDKKVFRQVWDISKKLPCVCLVGHVTWFPDEFLGQNMPAKSRAVDQRMLDQAAQNRSNWLNNKVQNISRECQQQHVAVSNWSARMLSGPPQNKSLGDLETKLKTFMEGIWLTCGMRHTVETMTNLHAQSNKPMTKNEVLALCRMMALSKAVTDGFHRGSMLAAESGQHIVQFLQYQILLVLQAAKKRAVAEKKYSDRRLDILSGLVLAESCAKGSPTLQRIAVAKLALSVANQSKIIRDDEYMGILMKLERLQIIGACGVWAYSKRASDQSSFYWHRSLFTTYLDGLCSDPSEAARLSYMFDVLEDITSRLLRCKHLASPQQLVQTYRDEMNGYVRQNLLDVICKEIENDLRLSVHTHLKLDDRNPFRVGVKSLRQLLAIEPLKFQGSFLDIKAYVTHYLDQTFYNLTTVALHDWKTYGEMRNLAAQKYQLEMQEVHLPNQQLEQGLDVLEIMRNIHVFVSKYLYNLNNQIFVERSSNNKHLNTINIRHIANSIRTHGTGIMNTTVNFTFQFLKKKFYIFSQFLFDEHIKSRLVKDIRDFRENRESLNQLYPYDRADKFNRGIRKLGLSADGSSYLDQFRLLISHIGNAMGYIRMVRSGGLHCCSNAIRFVPDVEDIVNFEELANADNISPEVNSAFTHIDAVIGSLAKNSAEGSDYLRMLVSVFAPEFRSSKNMHLRNFYVIIPALTINFVEHVISCKEKMNKKNKVGAAFTDDGFAIGLAYILKLVDQYSEFDSLHWFQSVRRKYEADVKSQQQPAQKQGKGAEDEKLLQTKALALKRIGIYQREFDLLYYSLSSARIFFRADLTAKEEAEEKGDKKPDEAEAQSATDGTSTDPTPAN
uniref:WASH complex subunit 7 n=1 Tax=Phallusia mammillata TaxID=59560 RepID=A0A6F9DXA2_9ASCI|nr:WASH complex subunit 7 [Phallusia mammillata]